jgi:hypothetical protein
LFQWLWRSSRDIPLHLIDQARFEVRVSFTWDLWSPKFFCKHFKFPLSLLTSPAPYAHLSLQHHGTECNW